jgi:hypothetical protein
MADELKNCRVAVLATDGFEQAELTEPVKALRQSGAQVDIVSPYSGEIQGMKHKEKGDKVRVDRALDEVAGDDYMRWCCPVALPILTSCVSIRKRYVLYAISSRPVNRSPRSVMGRGR